MSVQAGLWNFDAKPVDRMLLGGFSKALKEQGPDGEASYSEDSIAMLYRPFYTTAESRREKQPYRSPRGFVITWDGRLDNREDLIRDLRGHYEPDATDVTIVGAAFDCWGRDCFARMIGDWAISIWDATNRTLTFAKDYAGIRHLYYYLTEARVIWCTQLAPILLQSGSSFTVSKEYIAGYLAAYPKTGLTAYQEIRSVSGGSFVTIRNGHAADQRFWSFEPKQRVRYKTDADYEAHFRHVFRLAVRRRLRSDSPVLAELSGGIDSSSIVCIADAILAEGEASAPHLDTISIYDSSDLAADERKYFTIVEAVRGRTGHRLDSAEYGHFFSLDYRDFIAIPGSSTRAGGLTAAISELIHSHGYRVVLSGVGGDEFLGGVPNAYPQLADLIVLPRPLQLVRQLTAWSLTKKRPWIQILFETVLLLFPLPIRSIFAEHKVAPWIDAGFASRYRLAVRQLGAYGRYGFMLPSRRDCAQTFVTMRRQFACSPGHSLRLEEKRFPYLDQTLIEFLLAIPASQLLRPGQRRSLMRRSLAGLVPSEILLRKSKGGVARSILTTFQELWPELERLFASPMSGQMGYVDEVSFLAGLRTAKNGHAPQLFHLLKGIYLELWLRSLNEHRVVDFAIQSSVVPREIACVLPEA
jgi:asparagine synthase (glutamine-hydrolysing)